MAEEKKSVSDDKTKDEIAEPLADKKRADEAVANTSADVEDDDKKSFESKPSDAKALEDKSSAAKAMEDKYKRALADYQNLLKQTAKEKMEFAMFANEIMLREILPVYDHLKMAIEHGASESTDEWLTGVKHVVKQFKDVLEKIGVTEIKTAGEKFNHNSMEAIQNEETDEEKLDGQVARQMKAGYQLHGKVIEAAKVVVYKVK